MPVDSSKYIIISTLRAFNVVHFQKKIPQKAREAAYLYIRIAYLAFGGYNAHVHLFIISSSFKGLRLT